MLSLPHQSQRHEVAYASEHKLVSAEAVQQTDKQERLRLKRKCQVIRQNNIIQCRKYVQNRLFTCIARDREILSKWKFGYTKKQQVLASKYRSKSAEAIKEGRFPFGFFLIGMLPRRSQSSNSSGAF